MSEEKPFTATLKDVTRSHIEGYVNGKYYRIERDVPTPVSLAVKNALADSIYDVEITSGEDQANENVAETKEATNDGSTGNDGTGNDSDAKAGSDETDQTKEQGEEEAANGSEESGA